MSKPCSLIFGVLSPLLCFCVLNGATARTQPAKRLPPTITAGARLGSNENTVPTGWLALCHLLRSPLAQWCRWQFVVFQRRVEGHQQQRGRGGNLALAINDQHASWKIIIEGSSYKHILRCDFFVFDFPQDHSRAKSMPLHLL